MSEEFINSETYKALIDCDEDERAEIIYKLNKGNYFQR